MLKTYTLTFGLAAALLVGCGAGTVGSTDSADGDDTQLSDPSFDPVTPSTDSANLPVTNDDPVKPEECNNQLDDDHDGQVDENCPCDPAVNGGVQECYTGAAATRGQGACHVGTQRCLGDQEFKTWGHCSGEATPRPDVCGDGIDNDCNGEVDDAALCDPASGSNPGAGGATANPCAATPWAENCWDAPIDSGNPGGTGTGGPGTNGEPGGPGTNGGDPTGTGNPSGTSGGTPTPATLPVCDASNCSGCCDAQGTCRAPSAEHCGAGGGSCSTCSLTQQCTSSRGRCEVRRYQVIVVSGQSSRNYGNDARYNPIEYLVDGLFGDPDWYITATLFGVNSEQVLMGETDEDSDENPEWNEVVFEATEDQLLNRWLRLEVSEADSFLTFGDGRYGSCNQLITRSELTTGEVTIARCGKAMKNLKLALKLIPTS